jgi:enoyl-CoA hydratase
MAGLDPAIHVLFAERGRKAVDARHKAGHDEREGVRAEPRNRIDPPASLSDNLLTIPRQGGTSMSTQNVVVETKGRVGIIRLNRPQALNALNAALVGEMIVAIDTLEADDNIGCLIITGSDKAFAAGADIKEMAHKSYHDVNMEDFGGDKDRIARCRKPVIAAVAGFALGGGCEFAMQCDLIIAADNAKFGQPEIKLGVIPGYGGTQRLTHAVGKAKAMDLILTGRMMDAAEAERSGLVARVVPLANLMDEAMKAAETIAGMGLPSVYAAKESVNRAFEMTLAEGVRFERRVFHALFATEDQKEGMAAFVEKRPAKFKNR